MCLIISWGNGIVYGVCADEVSDKEAQWEGWRLIDKFGFGGKPSIWCARPPCRRWEFVAAQCREHGYELV